MTRPRERAAGMLAGLRARGLRAFLLPTLAIEPPADPGPLASSAGRLDHFDWVVLTSVNGVRALADAIDEAGAGGRDPGAATLRGGGRPRVAAVGPRTAEEVGVRLGWDVDLVPDRFTAEGLLRAMEEGVALDGARILLPLAERARPTLPEGLAARGASVERVVAYRSVVSEPEAVDELRGLVSRGEVALLTFTSPSTGESFLELWEEAPPDVPAAAIGPVTAEALREMGFEVAVVAEEHTVAGLVEAAALHVEGRRALEGGRSPGREASGEPEGGSREG